MRHTRHILHRLAFQQATDGLLQFRMLDLRNRQVGIEDEALPIYAEKVFEQDAHQLFGLALTNCGGEQLGEMFLRNMYLNAYHTAKVSKFPYFCREMHYLILAILFSTCVFVAMRLFERFHLDNHQALAWNYAVAAGTGFAMCRQMDTLPQLTGEPWFGLSLLTGFWFIFTYLLMTTSSQRSGVTITSLSSKLSVVIPTTLGVLLFHERLNFIATCGIVLSIVALFMVVGKGKSEEKKSKGWILPVVIFFGTGIGDMLMKFTERLNQSDDMTFMIAFIYLIAMLFGIAIVVFDLARGKSKWQWKNALGGLGLGIVNFFSSYCMYQGMALFDNTFLFPIYNIGVVSVTALNSRSVKLQPASTIKAQTTTCE